MRRKEESYPRSIMSIEYTIAYIDTRGLTEEQSEELSYWADFGPMLPDEYNEAVQSGKAVHPIDLQPTEWYPDQQMFMAYDSRSLPFWRSYELTEFYDDLADHAIAQASKQGITAQQLSDHFVCVEFVVCKHSCQKTADEDFIKQYSIPKLWDKDNDHFDEVFTFVERNMFDVITGYKKIKHRY